MGYYSLIVPINSGNSQGSDTTHLLSGKQIIEHWLAVNIHPVRYVCSTVHSANYQTNCNFLCLFVFGNIETVLES